MAKINLSHFPGPLFPTGRGSERAVQIPPACTADPKFTHDFASPSTRKSPLEQTFILWKSVLEAIIFS